MSFYNDTFVTFEVGIVQSCSLQQHRSLGDVSVHLIRVQVKHIKLCTQLSPCSATMLSLKQKCTMCWTSHYNSPKPSRAVKAALYVLVQTFHNATIFVILAPDTVAHWHLLKRYLAAVSRCNGCHIYHFRARFTNQLQHHKRVLTVFTKIAQWQEVFVTDPALDLFLGVPLKT